MLEIHIAAKSKSKRKPERSATKFTCESEASTLDFLIKTTGGQLQEMLKSMIPQSLREELVVAESYSSGGSELIQAICEIKQQFFVAGFDLQLKTKNEVYKESLNERIADVGREQELYKVAEELIRDYVSTDNCILLWGIDGKTLKYVTTISPGRVDYQRAIGGERMLVEMDDETRIRIHRALMDRDTSALELYPEKYVEAVRVGKRWVLLDNKDGEYWIVRSNARRFSGLARPSMRPIFGDVLLRETLKAGDWATAYYLKRVIEHVRAGESPPHGQLQNLRALYPTPDQITKYQKAFQSPGQTMRFFTDHTVKIEYPHPPVEIFAPDKYKKVEERILRWGGVPNALQIGEGGDGFSQGHLGIRRFVAEGWSVRRVITEIMQSWILHDSMRPLLKIPNESRVTVAFNEQTLKDPKQILDELNNAWDRGLLDNRSYNEGLGRSHDLIKARKREDAQDKELWVPTFEPKQGLLNEGGRPAGGGDTTPTPSNRPKPSTTKG